ncbi:MAG: hypothetical protein RRA94_04105 [Bacteroidota bacterium]|nr:hypothetical protein [Bacteroidota bacterium]
MKHLSIFLLITFLSTSLSAQEQETLFGSNAEHGGYGAVSVRFSSIQSTDAVLVGGYGGWLIDHRLMLGVGGFGLVTDVRARPVAQELYSWNNEALYVNFGYGGFMMEYTVAPSELLHFTVQALIGGGGVQYREDWFEHDDDWHNDSRRHGGTDALFVLEPAAQVEVNITPWFRASAGASYRHVSGIDELQGIENDDLKGVTGNLTFKFGAF